MTKALKEFEEQSRGKEERFAQAEVHVQEGMISWPLTHIIDFAVFLSCIMFNFCSFVLLFNLKPYEAEWKGC